MQTLEQFANTNDNTANIIVGAGMLVIGVIVTILFTYTYRKERSMFFATVMTVVLVYSIITLLTSTSSSSFARTVAMGMSAAVSIMCVVLIIMFSLKSVARLKEIKELSAPYQEMIE